MLEEKSTKETTVPESWPMTNIQAPGENDVMCGRGAGTNFHPGNKKYRKMVEERKIDYHVKHRDKKEDIAFEIIKKVRGQNPPGRFLKRNKETGKWDDIGDEEAKSKTKQTLRENGPEIRKRYEQETKRGNLIGDTTPTKLVKGQSLGKIVKACKKTILERGQSLSRIFNVDRTPSTDTGVDLSSPRETTMDDNVLRLQNLGFSRPETITKRQTSHINESHETKPRLKRAALNRDQSATTNRLKEAWRLRWWNRQPDESMSPDSRAVISPNRPPPVNTSDRMNTNDKIEHELLETFSPVNNSPSVVSSGRPPSISTSNRMNTYEKFEYDQIQRCSSRSDTSLVANDSPVVVSPGGRPSSISTSDRMNTIEFQQEVLETFSPVNDSPSVQRCSSRSDTSLVVNDSPVVVSPGGRPSSISTSDRMNTIEFQQEVLETFSPVNDSPSVVSSDRPSSINTSNRMNTYEKFEYDQIQRCSLTSDTSLVVHDSPSVVSSDRP